jgi:hypothetical protein
MIRNYEFEKDLNSLTFHKKMSCSEWKRFGVDFRWRIERLARYATFLSIQVRLNGELAVELKSKVGPAELKTAA